MFRRSGRAKGRRRSAVAASRNECERVTLFPPQDAAAGARGLAECASLLAAYRKCLAWHERARPQPAAYRVPEAYRPGGDAYGVHE